MREQGPPRYGIFRKLHATGHFSLMHALSVCLDLTGHEMKRPNDYDYRSIKFMIAATEQFLAIECHKKF